MQKGVQLFKALADQSRIRVINCLLDGPMYVEMLATRLELAPSTISFHLKKLEEAGVVYSEKQQYYTVYTLNEVVLNTSIISLLQVEESEKDRQDQREASYRKKVVNTFFVYGKLQSIPVQQKKRRIILEEIAKVFEVEKTYSEREVNIIIADYHDDFCTLRRGLVEEKLLERSGNVYKRG